MDQIDVGHPSLSSRIGEGEQSALSDFDRLHLLPRTPERGSTRSRGSCSESSADVPSYQQDFTEALRSDLPEPLQSRSPRKPQKHSSQPNLIASKPFSDQLCQLQHRSAPGRIMLNVGGKRYETSLSTLLCDRNSYFAKHLEWQQESPEIWIDRDGDRFCHILNYLRNGTLHLEDETSLQAICEEATFYQLSSLQKLCDEKISAILQARKIREERAGDTKQMLEIILSAIEEGQRTKMRKVSELEAPMSLVPVFEMNEDF